VSNISQELLSQPACWRTAAALAETAPLPPNGARIAVVGCGSSLYVAQAIAAWRESGGQGETDAFAASEMPTGRYYDHVVLISRSGTTTEILRLLDQLTVPVVAMTTTKGSPITERAESVVLDFADERSVVQTRSATTVLALWRAYLGHDVATLAKNAQEALMSTPPAKQYQQYVFLGRGAGAALASEAALKIREAAQQWSEAYPALEFRHGPISVITNETLVTPMGELDPELAREIEQAGATLATSAGDPMVDLVRAHRLAVSVAEARNLDPDHPRRLTRSVILR
jgi:fructoselysine-6-P-deglycase FrlB-like protein